MLGEQFIELSNHQRVRNAFVYKVADWEYILTQ
jgi:hypothetical protein